MAGPKRHFKRFSVNGIQGFLQGAQGLEVRNISLTGLAVESSVPLQIGHVYALTLRGANDGLEVPAEVRWCHLVDVRPDAAGQSTNVYHAGLDFSRALDDKAQELLNLIEGHIVVDVDRHLAGRFKTTDRLADFLVKRVSFSGMLVETRQLPPPPEDSVVEIEVDDEALPLRCTARAATVDERSNGEPRCDIRFEFQNLSIDGGLALDHFIRRVLE